MLKKLSEIQSGKSVRIHSFIKNDNFLKLMEMGCLPGEIISIEKIAPLGDPISIKVAGYLLSLGLNEAETILVESLINN
ncbi:MAG: FeoA family protein [Chitinophagaceae bacterium]|jgi:ferrous iron transport protein A